MCCQQGYSNKSTDLCFSNVVSATCWGRLAEHAPALEKLVAAPMKFHFTWGLIEMVIFFNSSIVELAALENTLHRL